MVMIFSIFVILTILVVSQSAFAQYAYNTPTTKSTTSPEPAAIVSKSPTITTNTVANSAASQTIPNYPTDALGAKIDKFPIVKLTPLGEVESDLTWTPGVILTGEKITFIFQFYDPNTSLTMPRTTYHFVISQNGNEIFNVDGATQEGGDYKYFVFNQAGPVQFTFEKIGGKAYATQYSTIVYANPSGIKSDMPVIQPAANFAFSPWDQLAFIGIPVTAVILIVIYAKWGNMFRKKRTELKEN